MLPLSQLRHEPWEQGDCQDGGQLVIPAAEALVQAAGDVSRHDSTKGIQDQDGYGERSEASG